MERRGAGEILLTSMDRDGTRAGYDLGADPHDRRRRRHPGDRLGRASGRSRIWSRASTQGHASAVLAASIFHFGQHSIAEAKAAMAAAGIPVRPT